MVEPELRTIHRAFEEAIEEADADPSSSWYSGVAGNFWVNLWGRSNYGLCYQWQEMVFAGVRSTVRSLDWETCGIQVNGGTMHEHHAVLVFDPQLVRTDHLLGPPPAEPVYVLDGWRRGRADIYRLVDWLELPSRIAVPPELEDLDAIVDG
jgi:hypothetical protein